MQPSPIDHRRRLARLMEDLGDGALLALAQPESYRNANVEHMYRQESFLHWLVGFDEPEAALLVLGHKPAGQKVHLFLREKDATREMWEGRRLGLAGAKAGLAIDEAHEMRTLWEKLPLLLGEASALHYNLGVSERNDREVIKALVAHKATWGRRRTAAKLPVVDVTAISGRMRLHKTPDEIERMRAAAGVTRATFAHVYKSVRPGMSERDVHGMILGEFLRNGGDMEAYGSIVAGGANACCLHYRSNDQALVDGQLLLIDAGAQYQYYASDVTRTFPVGKRFSPEQKAVYEAVLASQKRAIAKAVPGSTLNAVHDEATAALIEGLIDLKLVKGSKDEVLQSGVYRRYYPHNTSHWIGMDVHDVGLYHDDGKPTALAPGMYFSVEPGLYFDPADESVPAGFRGIGVRIEDDVLVTAAGNEVLTAGIAKEVAELENRY